MANMKTTQQEVESAADILLGQEGATITSITAYQVAKQLERNANSTVYRYFEGWKSRKLAEAEGTKVQLPPALLDPLAHSLDRLKAEMMAQSSAILSDAMKTLDDNANLKVADAQRRLDSAEGKTADLLDRWEGEETKLAAALERIMMLQTMLEDERGRVQVLTGRLQQALEDRRSTDDFAAVDGAD